MKKLLVVWLIITAAGMGFAQGLTFNGMVSGGIGFFKSDHENSELVIGHYNSSENVGIMAKLWADYTNSDSTAGARILFKTHAALDRDSTGAADFLIDTYEGWLKFFNGIVEIRGGYMDYNELYNPYGGVEAHMYNAEGWGIFVNANPFVGVNMRFGFFPTGGLGGNSSSPKEARYNLSLRYDLPGMAHIMLNAVRHQEDLYDIGFGVQIAALTGMVMGLNAVNLDFALLNILENQNANAGIQIGQRVDFELGSIGAGIRFMQLFVENREPDLTFGGYAQYAIGTIVPRLNFGVNIGSPLRNSNNIGPNVNEDFSGGANYFDSINKGHYYELGSPRGFRTISPSGGQVDAGNLVLQPGVQFRITGNQYIELAYTLQRDLSKPKGARTMNNLFSIEYKLEF